MNAIANHADIGGTQDPNLYFTDLQVTQFDRNETVKKLDEPMMQPVTDPFKIDGIDMPKLL